MSTDRGVKKDPRRVAVLFEYSADAVKDIRNNPNVVFFVRDGIFSAIMPEGSAEFNVEAAGTLAMFIVKIIRNVDFAKTFGVNATGQAEKLELYVSVAADTKYLTLA